MLEAYRRLSAGKPVVKRDHGPGKQFLFSLAGGEIIKFDGQNGQRGLYVVRMISATNSQIRFVPINDARKLKDIPKEGHTALPDVLRKKKCEKMVVTPLGEERHASD